MRNAFSSASNTSSTLYNGLAVLEFTCLTEQKKGITLQEIVRGLGMNRGNVYRYLKTLVMCGWLEYDPETFRYRIGSKPLQIAGASLQQIDLRAVARPHLEDLAEDTCLAVHLGVIFELSIIYIDKVDSNSPIQMRSHPGMRAPAYCTAMGKAILATYNPQKVAEIMAGQLHPRTPNTFTTIDELLSDLDQVRAHGFAVDHEENEPGIGCVGAAVYGYDNQVIGAISLSTLIQHLTPEDTLLYGKRIMKTASRISQSMGCNNNHWTVEPEHAYKENKLAFGMPE